MNCKRIVSFILLGTTFLLGCNLVTSLPKSASPTVPIAIVPEETPSGGHEQPTLPEPTSIPLPVNLIADYTLISDLSDMTGKNGPAIASIGSPSPDGFFCNAVCDLTTPALNGFNLNAFTIRAEFLEPKYPLFSDSVFIAGDYRWAKFSLLPEGKVVLVYNNSLEVPCSVTYRINFWHEAVITYDGNTLILYLDGIEGCRVTTVLEIGIVNNVSLLDASRGSSFIGIVRNLQIYDSVKIPQTRNPQPGNVTLTDQTLAPVDLILQSCPSEADLAAIDADLNLTFEHDPSAGDLVCHTTDGSRDLTSFKRIVYTTLLVMKELEFTQPLPWTSKPLYSWFIDTINGIRFRGDIDRSNCCEPGGVINIQTNLAVNNTDRWIDPQFSTGAQDLLVLFVHEARHNEFGGHTCGTNDNTRAEMGAWAVQYYLYLFLANNSKDATFLSIPVPALANFYSQIATVDAATVLNSSFCLDK